MSALPRLMTLIPRADGASLKSASHKRPLFFCPLPPAPIAAFPTAREKGGFLPCVYHQQALCWPALVLQLGKLLERPSVGFGVPPRGVCSRWPHTRYTNTDPFLSCPVPHFLDLEMFGLPEHI